MRSSHNNIDFSDSNTESNDELIPSRPTLGGLRASLYGKEKCTLPGTKMDENENDNDGMIEDMDYSSTMSMSSSFCNVLRPQLGLHQHAVRFDNGWQHIDDARIPKCERPVSEFDKFCIDFKSLSKWENYSYFNYYECLINGYLREIENEYQLLVIPYGVNIVCDLFFYDEREHITQISYHLHPCIANFDYEILKYRNDLKQELEIEGITGNEIFYQIQKNLNLTQEQTLNVCNLLLKYGFLRLIGVRRVLAINNWDFMSNDKYLYVFDINKQCQLNKYAEYQYSYKQTSWNIGVSVEFFDNRDSIWKLAKIVAIDSKNADEMLITINNDLINTDLIKVNRYSPKQIRSTKKYIENRENWKIMI